MWIWPVRDGDFDLPEEEYEGVRRQIGPPSPDLSFRPLGHISLDWVDGEGDKTLADRKEGRMTLSTFYILQSQQGKGLGRIVMDEVEHIIQLPPYNAKEITLNTLSASAASSPEFWYTLGVPYDPQARINAVSQHKLSEV
jgi:hypothetical protein